jgi:transcriptional regulator with XRE-family HTH domain
MNLAERVRSMRDRRAWSQEQLAEIAGVSIRTIQRVENGQPASFETLKSLASVFEVDLEALRSPEQKPEATEEPGAFLLRVTSGREIFAVVDGAHMFGFDSDEPSSDDEVDALGEFFDGLKDWGDTLADIPPTERLRLERDYTKQLEELEASGFWIFAGIDTRTFPIKGVTVKFRVAVVRAVRSDSPTIIVVDQAKATVYQKSPGEPAE